MEAPVGSYLSLSDLHLACHRISSLVCPSLGPNALGTLVSSSTGKVAVTSSGATVFQAVCFSHPMAQVVTKSALRHHRVTGDGSKTFVMLVEAILSHLIRDCELGGSGTKVGMSAVFESSERLAMYTAFNELKNHVISNVIIPAVMKHPGLYVQSLARTPRTEMKDTCFKLLSTYLNGRYSRNTTKHLANMMCHFLFDSNPHNVNLQGVVDSCIQHFSLICLENVGQPVHTSLVLEGVVIQRDFILLHETLKSSAVRFLLLGFTVEEEEGPNPVTVSIKNQEDLIRNLNLRRQRVQTVCSLLQQLQVNLIISSVGVSETLRAHCQRAGVSVIQMVPEEEVDRIASVAAIHVIHTSRDLLEFQDSKIVGCAEKCDTVIVSNHSFVRLKGVTSRSEGCFNTTACQLVLCAPSLGLCKQLALDLQGALQSILMWFDQNNVLNIDSQYTKNEFSDLQEVEPQGKFQATDLNEKSDFKARVAKRQTELHVGQSDLLMEQSVSRLKPKRWGENYEDSTQGIRSPNESHKDLQNGCTYAIPGGGSWEMWIYNYLTDYSQTCSNHRMKTACQVLAKAHLHLPLQLLKNSYISENRKHLSDLLHGMGQVENGLVTLDGRAGKISAVPSNVVKDCEVMEPLASKLLLLYHVLELVQQLLRTEMMVSVKRLGSVNSVSDESE